MPGNDRERSKFGLFRDKNRKLGSFFQDFSLRPAAKDLGITRVVVVFHLSHFLVKRNLSEKISPWPRFAPRTFCTAIKRSTN